MEEFWSSVFNFARDTTHRVGTHLLPDFRQVQASQKDDGSLVTRADHWADDEIRKAIASEFPTHGVLSVESRRGL